MFKRLFPGPRALQVRPLLIPALLGCVIWLACLFFRLPVPADSRGVLETTASTAEIARETPPRKFEGDGARIYLEQTREGQSLMHALTAARFGLKREEHSPSDTKSRAGYLAMSHDQNLNTWFGEDGITVRPTLSEHEGDKAWRLGLKLRSYGYGDQLTAVPPVTSQNVKDNRIEYTRSASTNPQSDFRNPQLTEWYENQSAGIEQGFTLSSRPERGGEVGVDEPLRLVVGVTGDLRARANDEGQAIVLSGQSGEGVLSYSKLTAVDANGKKLAARMEASADEREIALVVDDREAVYPVVIDPITASVEKEFDGTQTDSRFGFAVAIDGDRAVVGAWREDKQFLVDSGDVYLFVRSGSNWSLDWRLSAGLGSNASCGWSVAISGNRVVFGCPGINIQSGQAFLRTPSGGVNQIATLDKFKNGDQFGYSVAISGTDIVVSAPFVDDSAAVQDTGRAYTFIANSDGTVSFERNTISDNVTGANSQLGAAVAIDGLNIILGAPGSGAGQAQIWTLNQVNRFLDTRTRIQASDGEAGDQFGNSVAIDGNTAVIGAYGDDDRGTDAGAAYVFVSNPSGQWSQQQKLKGSGSRGGDHFSQHAVAIKGNTIVVGADEWDFFPDDNAGAVYIFTRNATVWTQQTELDGASAYNFGIGVDISGNSILIGARGADAPGVPRAGTAYVYRLDCVPPQGSNALSDKGPSESLCPGQSTTIYAYEDNAAPYGYQWRHNGVNIPGATNSIYQVTNATAADAGTYEVIVSNACGGDLSSPFSLTVHSFSINPTSQNFGASGSTGIVNVTTSGSCPWTAVSNAPFITVTSGASGNGSGTVGFSVAANPNAGQRSGTITIGSKTFTVSQDGTNCSYSIAPTSQSLAASASTNTVNVTAGAGCAWTATSNDPSFLSINSGASGNGNGTVTYTVAANTGPARTGTLTIANQTFTVTQPSGCTYSLTPTAQNFTASGGTTSVNVTSGGGCAWTATSNSPSFITINSGASGTGNGTVSYTVAANSSTSSRSGSITVAGQTFIAAQDGATPATPTAQLSAASYNLNEADGHATIIVNRAGDISGAATVNYATTDTSGLNECSTVTGVASQRCDYAAGVGTLRFAAGETSKNIFIPIVDDAYAECTESFSITLSNPTGVTLGATTTATITITDNESSTGANPLAANSFFVRQHYIDFLGREPEPAGLQGWLDVLNNCGVTIAPPCDRIEVSSGFFRSEEFQTRGYFVYRFYSAVGRIPLYNDFIPDFAKVSGFLSAQQLEDNKVAFVQDFMTRSDYQTKYGSITDPTNYVTAVLQTLGLPNHPGKASWISSLTSGAKTKAQVLREVTESTEVYQKYYTEAFVIMQYFGYLRRSADGSYVSWIQTMNSTNGDYRTMINGFLNSAEYRLRFGP
ncbi:MAG: hypothetical protein QOJ64_958 [Acidobacteriota bacterium]|jgi:hypothetical protein|nr:hypothetical protein [Acidobacteriota bacterium]